MTNPILVTGGSGDLGREVVRRLVAEGRPARIMSRRPRPADEPNEWARCDLKTGDGLAGAVDGVSAIIHCASTLGRGDERVTRNLVEAARRAGSPHLVYISIVGIDVIRSFYYDEKLASESSCRRGSGSSRSAPPTSRIGWSNWCPVRRRGGCRTWAAPIVSLWLPGKAARTFRAGGNLTPENATGVGTFEEFLSSRV
ncbi:SDR family oxidoreductase [Amycolatopsis coloradensis]|uniref:SDR family oxidoreductase n=1 Tax=Amycolatopsis coloradensis TaxID=76021 RepID=UPI003CC91054